MTQRQPDPGCAGQTALHNTREFGSRWLRQKSGREHGEENRKKPKSNETTERERSSTDGDIRWGTVVQLRIRPRQEIPLEISALLKHPLTSYTQERQPRAAQVASHVKPFQLFE